MVATGYVPEAGDLVWLDFDPQASREQAGHRPAIVLSPAAYNQRTSLAIMCPITSHVKGYPFEVSLPKGAGVSGVVLSDHLKSQDWRARRVRKVGKAPGLVLQEIRNRIGPLLGF